MPNVNTKEVLAKIILQQCTSAQLAINVTNKADVSKAEFIEIGNGLVVYVCFMKNCIIETLDKVLQTVMSVKLSQNDDGKRVSILDLPGDILIIPQATLGGKMKGKSMQYHYNVEKSFGQQLYSKFVDMCREALHNKAPEKEVKYGTYGNLQVLNIFTHGPYTHSIDIT